MPPSAIAVERRAHDRERLGVAVPRGRAQAEVELRRVRKLGRAAEAAVHRIERALELPRARAAARLRQRRRAGAGPGLEARSASASRPFCSAIASPCSRYAVGDPRQQVEEARQPVAPLLREVRAAEERRAVGREEHRQRPAAAAPRQQRVRGLVDLVEVGPLLAVDLDVDERVVHHRGDRRILERLVRHHVAPVARRVADRQQDRLVLGARPGERLVAPRIPVDRDCPRAGAGRDWSRRRVDWPAHFVRGRPAVATRASATLRETSA